MNYEHSSHEHERLMTQLKAVAERESALLQQLIPSPPATILDVGCAAGTSGRLLKMVFPDAKLWGIEQDDGAAQKAYNTGLYQKVYTGGVPKHPRLEMDFAMVYSRLVLRHTPLSLIHI